MHIARRALNKDRTACRNRPEAARIKVVLAQLRVRLKQVDSQLEQIVTELARLIAEDQALTRRKAIWNAPVSSETHGFISRDHIEHVALCRSSPRPLLAGCFR